MPFPTNSKPLLKKHVLLRARLCACTVTNTGKEYALKEYVTSESVKTQAQHGECSMRHTRDTKLARNFRGKKDVSD